MPCKFRPACALPVQWAGLAGPNHISQNSFPMSPGTVGHKRQLCGRARGGKRESRGHVGGHVQRFFFSAHCLGGRRWLSLHVLASPSSSFSSSSSGPSVVLNSMPKPSSSYWHLRDTHPIKVRVRTYKGIIPSFWGSSFPLISPTLCLPFWAALPADVALQKYSREPWVCGGLLNQPPYLCESSPRNKVHGHSAHLLLPVG